MKSNNSESKYADVPIIVKTWVFIVLVCAVAIAHPLAMKIFISWIGFQSFFELSRMFKVKTNLIGSSLLVGLTQFTLLFFFSKIDYLLYSFVFIIVLIVYFLIRKTNLKQIIGIFIALILGLVIFPHIEYIKDEINLKALIFLVIVTELNDVFQYLMGKTFGKRKIIPKISPNKTWAGVILGITLTIILSIILGYLLLASSSTSNALLGLVLGIFGFFGDSFISLIKRKTNVKDTGILLPGHGGLLDRMDSLIFNVVIFYFLFPIILFYE